MRIYLSLLKRANIHFHQKNGMIFLI